jgi:valine--pyruvate aminotransferase
VSETFSEFGRRMASHSGIVELMDDLGKAMAGHEEMLMLGGGNPAGIPRMQEIWHQDMDAMLQDRERFDRILCHYDVPQGSPRFLAAVARLFRDHYGWDIGPQNVAVTNSSQNAYFMLLNMLAGEFEDGTHKKILLPLAPEYIGYADQGLSDDFFVACKPIIKEIGDHEFKYHVDFDNLTLGDDIGAVCVSRPTNPTGNVLTDEEVLRLSAMTKARGIPLLIDNAYGAPFPNIIFGDVAPFWDEHVILTLSLSKLGLPGTRTGIVIASEKVIAAVASANAIISLASGNIGQALVVSHMESGRILEFSQDIVRPFYEERLHRALDWVGECFDQSLPWRLHTCEGALFLWLWCRDMPIDSRVFYERLKSRGVLVVPGCYFFYGLSDDWPHQHECIRINYSQPEPVVREGLRIIAEEMRKAYA